jgi:hypothetical protein
MFRVFVLALLLGFLGLVIGLFVGSTGPESVERFQFVLATYLMGIGAFIGAAVGTAGVLREAIDSAGKRFAEALKSQPRGG